jgi:hypothetical protein
VFVVTAVLKIGVPLKVGLPVNVPAIDPPAAIVTPALNIEAWFDVKPPLNVDAVVADIAPEIANPVELNVPTLAPVPSKSARLLAPLETILKPFVAVPVELKSINGVFATLVLPSLMLPFGSVPRLTVPPEAVTPFVTVIDEMVVGPLGILTAPLKLAVPVNVGLPLKVVLPANVPLSEPPFVTVKD